MAPRLNVPPLTRSVLVVLVALTVCNALLMPDYRLQAPFTRVGNGSPILSIVPGLSATYPWVFLTATLVEQNIFGLLVTGLTVFYGGRYLERAWGSAEFAKFLLFASMIPNIITFVLYLLFYVLTKKHGALTTTISGGVPLQAAFLVSFKQLVPEHTVSLLRGLLRIRVKHLSALFLLSNTLSGLLFGTDTALFLAWAGFLTAWTYLRFYRVSPALTTAATSGDSAVVRGDASDTFAFAHFFPEPLHTPLAALCDRVYDGLVAVRICTPFSDEAVDAGNEQALARAEGGLPSLMGPGRGGRHGGGGGGRREEAERRRALALKALDQRLHAAAGRGQQQTGVTQQPVVLAATQPATGLGETRFEPEGAEGRGKGEGGT